jgi:hypothetical protein
VQQQKELFRAMSEALITDLEPETASRVKVHIQERLKRRVRLFVNQ